ncbi:MAG: hypothetical protein U5R31_08250 [Acidimicrobiia bacterium]|nr:hypothetical protein [Acidimicrobiia bacterium]
MRTLVVWCPDWPVAAHGRPPDVPAVVVVGNRVLACSAAARAHDVRAGQRRREAQGRCPALEVLGRDEPLEARVFEPVTAAVATFTPRGRADPPRSLRRRHPRPVALLRRRPRARRCRPGRRGRGGGRPVRGADRDRRTAPSPPPSPPGTRAPSTNPWSCRRGDRRLPRAAPGVGARPSRAWPACCGGSGCGTLGAFAALAAADVVGRFGDDGAPRTALAARSRRTTARRRGAATRPGRARRGRPARRAGRPGRCRRQAPRRRAPRRARGTGLSCTRVAVEAETDHGERLVRSLAPREACSSAGAIADRVRWQLEGWLEGTAASGPPWALPA